MQQQNRLHIFREYSPHPNFYLSFLELKSKINKSCDVSINRGVKYLSSNETPIKINKVPNHK